MTASSFLERLDAEASPRFGAWVIGASVALTALWMGLITSEQRSFYDPLCGSVGTLAADRYAECMVSKFSGRSASAEEDMEKALAHMKSRFSQETLGDGSLMLEHKGALLAAGRTPARFFVGVEEDLLVVRALKADF